MDLLFMDKNNDIEYFKDLELESFDFTSCEIKIPLNIRKKFEDYTIENFKQIKLIRILTSEYGPIDFFTRENEFDLNRKSVLVSGDNEQTEELMVESLVIEKKKAFPYIIKVKNDKNVSIFDHVFMTRKEYATKEIDMKESLEVFKDKMHKYSLKQSDSSIQESITLECYNHQFDKPLIFNKKRKRCTIKLDIDDNTMKLIEHFFIEISKDIFNKKNITKIRFEYQGINDQSKENHYDDIKVFELDTHKFFYEYSYGKSSLVGDETEVLIDIEIINDSVKQIPMIIKEFENGRSGTFTIITKDNMQLCFDKHSFKAEGKVENTKGLNFVAGKLILNRVR